MDLNRGHLDAKVEFSRQELADGGANGARPLEDNKSSRLCDAKVGDLTRGRVCGVCKQVSKSMFTQRRVLPMTEKVAPTFKTAMTATTKSTLRCV